MKKVTVSVPASTSNLGPGFDALGLALELRNEITVTIGDHGAEPLVIVEGEGLGQLSGGGENLVARAVSTVLAGRRLGGLTIRCVNKIPLARGLGSSAAAAVGGLAAANELIGRPLSLQQLFEYASVLDGHPDNAAAAVFGGLAACLREGKETRAYKLQTHPDLRAVVCVPELQLKTADARAILPQDVSRDAAVYNVARAALLSAALSDGHWDRLGPAMDDRLHQPYRASLIPGFAAVLTAARGAGARGACLSGAGSSILALGSVSDPLEAVGQAMVDAFARFEVRAKALTLAVACEGVKIS